MIARRQSIAGTSSMIWINYTLMLAPKGTPTEIIPKLSGEIAKALNAADFKE